MDEQRDDLAPTERFSSRVEHYAKYRPGYPPGIIDFLGVEAGLKSDSTLADVGSGTGILSEIFLQHGNPVFAIEPNREMRLAAEKSLARYPKFRSINATGESTSLPDASVDAVLCAQAFHWLDGPRAAAEFHRILKPAGFIALIWNVRDTAASPFMTEYERIVHEFGTDFARSGKELVPFTRLSELFGTGLRELSMPNFQELDKKGLEGRMLSASYMPQEGAKGYEAMMRALDNTFEQYKQDGFVKLEYQTRVYLSMLP